MLNQMTTQNAGFFRIPFPSLHDVMLFSSRDMILLGMKPSSTEAQVREYFKDKADVVMVQVLDFQCQMSKF